VPTQSEARAAALEALVPPAILSLKAHPGTGDPLAWRAALRVLEHAIGRPRGRAAPRRNIVRTDEREIIRITDRGGAYRRL
jgi:hypothetical protein